MTSRDDKRQNDAFVDGVLSRTTGQACERALGQLDDLMENRLQSFDRQLVQGHLEHCEGCRSVAVTVGWLQPLLPDMAEVKVSPDFLSGVLARTSRVEAPRNLSVHP
ncbi:MAG: putative anti-sigma-YlaC factor YlaD, partial [Candidatus Krumholzibacteriia bacterium]